MYLRKSGVRRISIAVALLCLGAGLTASAAETASAATQNTAIATHTATALTRAAASRGSSSAGIVITNPGTQQSEPDTVVTLDLIYSDTGGVTQDFSATGLPPDLSINSSTGVISGTTGSTIASYNVTVSDTDSGGTTATVSFTWNVWNKITVASLSDGQFYWRQPATAQVGASDSASGTTLAYSASGLPAGMSMNSSTGVISGTPTAVGKGAMTVTVTDGTGSVGTGTFGWAVASNVSFSLFPGSRTSAAGQTANLTISATDTPPEPLTYSTSGLPPGLKAYGPDIIGWPVTPGTYNVSDAASDSYGGFTAGQFPWTVTAAADSGPNGPVRLNLGGKCLDDTGNSSANGNKVQIWSCNGDAAQKWTYAEDGTLRVHGKCLDVIGRGTSSGTGVQIWSCTGAANQQWVADTDAQFVNPAADLCLTDPGGSTANGTKLQINSCGTGARDEWTIPAGAVLSAISGRCMDDLGNDTANGAKVDAYNCNGGNPQKWTLDPDGTIRVNGKCLDDTDDSTTSGTKIQLWNCNGDASQRWTEKVSISPLGIELQHGSLCVSPTSMTAAKGAQLVLGTCGSEESNWHAW
jgi:hypothetical protein